MSLYPKYTKDDLGDFSGRPSQSYSKYSETALAQALLLFKIGTCLAQFPDDPVKSELAKNAILSMADNIFLAQRYQQAAASPFNSETIGSYSYSKTAAAVSSGKPTGIMWFDLAIEQLSVCSTLDDGVATGGGIGMFEYDGVVTASSGPDTVRFLGPQELELSRGFGYDPSRGSVY